MNKLIIVAHKIRIVCERRKATLIEVAFLLSNPMYPSWLVFRSNRCHFFSHYRHNTFYHTCKQQYCRNYLNDYHQCAKSKKYPNKDSAVIYPSALQLRWSDNMANEFCRTSESKVYIVSLTYY